MDSNIKSVLEEKIPKKLIQERSGGGNTKLSYVSGNFVIDQLNRAFNYMWSWSIEDCWIQQSEPKKWKDRNTGKENVIPQGPVAHVRGTLTVMLKDENGQYIEIKKSATGSKSIVGGQSEQESMYKAAGTDALKKAASLFGVGAQLYRDPKEQAYFESRIGESYWDDETKAKYEKEFNYINHLYESFSKDDIDEMVDTWSDGKFKSVLSLTPNMLVEFVSHTQAQEAAAE